MDPALQTAAGLVILIFSVILHEVMHGFTALKFGDRTAENAGRLTLNPISHIDLFGTILLPVLLFLGSGGQLVLGYAKPVPVNPLNFRDIRKGELFVSAAGIATNFGLASVAALLYHLLGSSSLILAAILIYAVKINLVLAIFNLLPIPPLDGSKVVMSLLNYQLAKQYQQLEQFGFLIILGLMYLGILNVILSLILVPLYALLGIPPFR